MIDFFRNWILHLIGAALLCAVALELTPNGAVKRVQRLVCGVVMASAILLPLLRLDFSDYALHLAESRAASAAVRQSANEISERLNRRSIEAQLEAYILDKAQTVNAQIRSVNVTARWSTEGVWYPVTVTVEGAYNAALADIIEGELGIAGEEQKWIDEVT